MFKCQFIITPHDAHTIYTQALAATAVTLSAVNLVGGTVVTKKMLDMFRRPTDPPEYNHYYLMPGLAAVAGSGALFASGQSRLTHATGCIPNENVLQDWHLLR